MIKKIAIVAAAVASLSSFSAFADDAAKAACEAKINAAKAEGKAEEATALEALLHEGKFEECAK